MFASPAQFDPYAFAHIATGSPSPSTASSSSSASPSLFDLPSPRSMPISTPSPSSSSSLALPFYPDTHTGRSSSYDSALGDFPSSATTSTGGMTINPSLLFGADLCAPAPTDSAQRGRRASANDTVDEGAKSAKSWLDALKQAEIKAKLRRLQSQPQFDGPPTPGSGGRMAQLQSQLLAQSMAPQSGAGIVAQCEASTAMLGGAAFPWVR
ncbi:putative DNA mismatch repair protein [Rhodotorula toruloides ATCC 204091]|uniref:BY PROTMAP: gi/342320851/gb/EGU12789.1/ putative DNA mismatch repair protein [Rhodotorula glutinis ATCC 204091] n=1 Tax=Rhodotorula toruloides TaxID=5286 RepID=A0A0K3CDL3_RHOTO|nr:putative DNA mismatch repair protein [Rhodotorula toruloides ATCC 204091]